MDFRIHPLPKRGPDFNRAERLNLWEGLSPCGVEGSRTPVQTTLPLIFYMLIVLLLVGGKQEKHKPIYYLAEWYLNKRHSLLLSHPVLF